MALVDLGEYYEVQLLKDKCDEFLTQNSTKIENVLKVYESLKVYSLENAMTKVMEFVAENTADILKCDEFLSAKKETIYDIAKMKNLTAKQEEVFEAICKWNEHNCPKETVKKNRFLKKQMKDIIPLIDFSSMDFNFLHNFVVRKGFLFPNFDDLADALCEAAAKKQQAKEESLIIVPKRKRVEITDGDGRKAYADICDPLIIAALETMISNETPQVKPQTRYGGIQWNANIGHEPAKTKNLCLFRDPSGYLSLKYYGPHKTNPSKICFHDYEEDYTYSYEEERSICEGCYLRNQEESVEPPIIAPVFIESDRFTPDYRCTMKFL
uniref:BACK domain-containing protein n=1 Tax=Panagrolaimus davidi TaxID=227884 RepID=A0A914Q928_9BILA